jgi:tRNA threonylcarbamoyladenosine biosynthesis protein TsaE
MTDFRAVLGEEELRAWGERVGAVAEPPLVLALRGDLGAGKSTLARAIARGAGVAGAIPSPTFNLLFRYPAGRGVEFVHLDLYRLKDPDEVWDLGWSELPGEREIVVVEWPEHAEHLLPAPRWEVRLEAVEEGDRRALSLHPVGEPPALPRPEDGR